MNGKTMLNGVPYFSDTQVIELTRAEYDALPNSKYTDGVLYCIKDEGVMKGDTFSPIIYSLAEREIGVWCDGKPLYQKTIHIGALTPIDNIVAHNISNIERIVDLCGYSSQGARWFPLPYVQTSNLIGYQTKIYADETNVYCTILNDDYITDSYVTIQYTKTTDNPGTGKWTTSGVPAHHYSTDEQVIGTWIDGSTLYEKTVQLTLTPGLNTTTIAHGISGINRVIDYNGSLFGSMYGLDKTCKMSQSVFNSSTSTGMSANATYCANIHYVDATNVMYSLGSAYPANIQLNLTVQYTKSS